MRYYRSVNDYPIRPNDPTIQGSINNHSDTYEPNILIGESVGFIDDQEWDESESFRTQGVLRSLSRMLMGSAITLIVMALFILFQPQTSAEPNVKKTTVVCEPPTLAAPMLAAAPAIKLEEKIEKVEKVEIKKPKQLHRSKTKRRVKKSKKTRKKRPRKRLKKRKKRRKFTIEEEILFNSNTL